MPMNSINNEFPFSVFAKNSTKSSYQSLTQPTSTSNFPFLWNFRLEANLRSSQSTRNFHLGYSIFNGLSPAIKASRGFVYTKISSIIWHACGKVQHQTIIIVRMGQIHKSAFRINYRFVHSTKNKLIQLRQRATANRFSCNTSNSKHNTLHTAYSVDP